MRTLYADQLLSPDQSGNHLYDVSAGATTERREDGDVTEKTTAQTSMVGTPASTEKMADIGSGSEPPAQQQTGERTTATVHSVTTSQEGK